MDHIDCKLCGAHIHSVQLHLRDSHAGVTLTSYQNQFPDAEILSPLAKKTIADKQQKAREAELLTINHAVMQEVPQMAANAPQMAVIRKQTIGDAFGLGALPELLSSRGTPIEIATMTAPEGFADFVPDKDKGHVWNIDDLKNMLMAVELNMPLYVWGHKGTGKTTDLEQLAAFTGRPLMRVQHTLNTEESHIVGQWTIKGRESVFELGPLAIAMKYGYIYLADEYDFAMASVLSVYQPVLEGKALFIKEADAANRIIKPHPNFRFFATGNTNGSGDDTGLYQGTSVQNAANYDRFGMCIQKQYMIADKEATIVRNRSGISEKEAKKLIDFAVEIRKMFEGGKLSDTISSRALIAIAMIGLRKGGMKHGVELCYTNKLSKVDRSALQSVAQRVWG